MNTNSNCGVVVLHEGYKCEVEKKDAFSYSIGSSGLHDQDEWIHVGTFWYRVELSTWAIQLGPAIVVTIGYLNKAWQLLERELATASQ